MRVMTALAIEIEIETRECMPHAHTPAQRPPICLCSWLEMATANNRDICVRIRYVVCICYICGIID